MNTILDVQRTQGPEYKAAFAKTCGNKIGPAIGDCYKGGQIVRKESRPSQTAATYTI